MRSAVPTAPCSTPTRRRRSAGTRSRWMPGGSMPRRRACRSASAGLRFGADQPVRPCRRGGALARPRRGRHPRGGRRLGIRLHPFELLRSRDDPRLLGTAAPEPPHRGDHDALRRARVRARAAARGPGCRDRTTRLHGDAMLAGVEGLGLTVFGDVAHKMTNVVAVEIPRGWSATRCARSCSATSASRSAPRSVPCTAASGGSGRWGTTPEGCRAHTLAALEAVLRRHGAAVAAGGGVEAAQGVYAGAGS